MTESMPEIGKWYRFTDGASILTGKVITIRTSTGNAGVRNPEGSIGGAAGYLRVMQSDVGQQWIVLDTGTGVTSFECSKWALVGELMF